jgi:histidine kinase/DNA gyrase B/HSP90-like ATPase
LVLRMKTKQSTPYAPLLIESMRSLGYSFDTAIADLIDNSVSAKAKNINILLDPSDDPQLIIFDDGLGMDSATLEEALRFGSRGPSEIRDKHDLGRFGLGLKSASLSQCRRLVVASKHNGQLSCFSWDLDEVQRRNDWAVLEYSQEEIGLLPSIELFDGVKSGTYVLLQNFDRISASSHNVKKTLDAQIEAAEDHLSLVFHRIISEDGLKIFINGRLIEPKDPFLEDHKSTQHLREQSIRVDDATITLKPYILPHRNKLSREDLRRVGGADDLRMNQGFYIYRCKRLILWGTWFRLLGKDELNKLARVKVDIPNSLDEIWSIDVKKSTANLPDKIRKNLYSSIKDSVFGSKKVIEYRGKLDRDDETTYIWQRLTNRDGGVTYSINRDLPQLRLLLNNLDGPGQRVLEMLLQNIEQNFPANSMYLDVADGEIQKNVSDAKNIAEDLEVQLSYAEQLGLSRDELLSMLLKTEPYSGNKELQKMFSRVGSI